MHLEIKKYISIEIFFVVPLELLKHQGQNKTFWSPESSFHSLPLQKPQMSFQPHPKMIERHEHKVSLREGHPPVPVQGQAADGQPFSRNFDSDFPII